MSLLLLFRPRGGVTVVAGAGTILRIDRTDGPYRTHSSIGAVGRPRGQAGRGSGPRIDRPTVGSVT